MFGTRLSLALPLDELLLQLAETLRRTLRLETAEVWIASDSLLERAASDPPAAGSNVVLTDGEIRVLVRAGVCGAAWAAVWLPVLVEGRAHAELRVAPIVNADELLGLIVVQRHRAASRSTRRTSASSASSPGRPDWRSATCGWTPRCRPRSTSCGCRPRSSAPHAAGRRGRRRRAAPHRA